MPKTQTTRAAATFWSTTHKKQEAAQKARSNGIAQPPLTKQKQKHRARLRKHRYTAYFVSTIMILCAASVSYFSWDERVSIGEISVSGNSTIPTHILTSAINDTLFANNTGYISPRTMVTVDTARIEHRLTYLFPKIERVVVNRSISNVLFVHVDERIAKATYCADESTESCYLIDSTGYIFEPVDEPYGVIYRGGVYGNPLRQTILKGTYESITHIIETLEKERASPIEVTFSSDLKEFTVLTKGGPSFRFLVHGDVHETSRIILHLLQASSMKEQMHDIEYFDLRFGDRVFMKRKSTEGSSSM